MNIRQKLLVALIKWLSRFAPVKSEPLEVKQEKQEENARKVGAMALTKAGLESVGRSWEMPKLPLGVMPSIAMDGTAGMAQDNAAFCASFLNNSLISNLAITSFKGYAELAEMSQLSEYRSPTVTLATEMTRKWISFKSTGDEDRTKQLQEIEIAFDKFKVRETIKQAIESDGFFGRGMIYVDTGKPDLDNVPLIINSATIRKGDLKGFKSVEPIWTSPANYNSIDPTAPDFYKPSGWYVMGKHIHNSRLMTMVSHPLPDILKPAYNFSGLSMTQLLEPTVEQWRRTRDAVSELVHSYSTSGVKTDMQAVLSGGNGDDILHRAQLFNQLRDNRGLMLLDNDTEEFFQFNTPLSGVDALQAQAQEQMAAPCHIPLVKLFGITPNGLNASSEGEIKVFYDYVAAMQQALLTDPLVKILQIIQLHLFGEIYDDITFEYCPLEQMTDEQIATNNKAKADIAAVLVGNGIISAEEERARLAADPISGYNGIDAEELPEQENEDPAMDSDPKWHEEDHPRAENGKFGAGSNTPQVNPANHKGKTDIKSIFSIATSRNEGNKSFANISQITDDMANKVKSATGVDVKDWVHGIDEAAIRHILKKHGDAVSESKRGQVAVTKDDIENLGQILNDPDSVKYGGINDRGNETVELEKTLNGKVYVVHEVRTGQKKMSVVSMWITKAKKSP